MDHFIIQNGRSDSLGGGGFEVFNANLIMIGLWTSGYNR